MSVTLQFKLTQAGQTAAFNANKTGLSLNLTHVQVGSGNKTPSGAEIALLTPLASVPIASGFSVSPSQIRMTAVFEGNTNFAVREIGLWSGAPGAAGSVLACYWSQISGDLAVKAAGVDFVFTHDMVIDTAVTGGSLSVVADPSQSAVLAMIAAHERHVNPHSQYTTAAMVQSWIGARTGDVINSTGVANTYVVALTPAATVYSATTAFTFKANFTNTGAALINAGPGNRPLLTSTGAPLVAGKIQSGDAVTVVYDEKLASFVVMASGRPAAQSTSGLFAKADSNSVVFKKTGAGTLSIKAGTFIDVSGQLVSFAADTAVTMTTLTAGADYSIWCTPAGTLQAVADPYWSPAAAPVVGARKIGGFHYSLTAPGTTVASGGFNIMGSIDVSGMVWGQDDVDDIAGINKYSLWDLKWRSAGEQHGFAFDPWKLIWCAIYFGNSNHVDNGISRYNTDVISNVYTARVPPMYGGKSNRYYTRTNWWTVSEVAASHGARLPTVSEFASLAFGVTENQSLGGGTAAIPSTNRQAGYTSRIGIEQATGHHSVWGADSFTRYDQATSFAWHNTTGGRGQIMQSSSVALVRVKLGGTRDLGVNSGSRCSTWVESPGDTGMGVGLRAVCEHLQLT